MKKNRIILVTLFLSIASFVFHPFPAIALEDNNHYIKRLIDGIDAIKSYQVNLNTKIFPPNASDLDPNAPDEFDPNRFMEVKSEVFGESGKRMNILIIMKSREIGAETEHKLIFDGTWLWVQQKVNKHPQMKTDQPMISAMKIHIPSVSPDPVKEPFNTIYGMAGTGLFRYRDLPGTFMDLIEEYSFESAIKSPDSADILFTGMKKVTEKAPEIERADKKLAEFMDKSSAFCKLWVSGKSGLIVAYSIGKSEKRPTMKTEIEYISVNKQLPDNIFSYVPPEGVVVRNATANILKQKTRNQ